MKWIGMGAALLTAGLICGCSTAGLSSRRRALAEADAVMAGSQVRVPDPTPASAAAANENRAFYPPTLYELQRFIDAYDLQVDANEFLTYHVKHDWRDRKGDPITDWRGEVILWNDEAAAKATTK